MLGAWNVLPGEVVDAGIHEMCKRLLYSNMDMQGMEGYTLPVGRD